jgi:4-amino-4-deoxy-L-arabinose transferase-like glycosyltransferase
MSKLINIKTILVVGIIIRIAFLIWGAPLYYGTPNYSTSLGDTWSWMSSMQNLVHTGTYTADPTYEDGKFFRPPGYSFFLMIFYFITGFDVEAMPLLIIGVQAIMDTFSILFIYKIIQQIGGSKQTALIGAFLYCFYPFVIVWTAVLTAETSGIFFLLLSLVYITKGDQGRNYLKAGLFIGISILLRVQTIFIIPPLILYFLMKYGSIKNLINKNVIAFFIALTLSYGLWPARNLCYGKFIPAEEIVNDKHFSIDFTEFMFYIWSVKTDHRPQFDQIIEGKTVQWPKESYLLPGDSIKLAKLSALCYECGRGFSHWKYSAGLIKQPITAFTPCTEEIAKTFDELHSQQIKYNKYNFFIVVPLSNLKKAFFKSALYEHTNKIVVLFSSILFTYRTLCIFLGLLGSYLCFRFKMMDKNFNVLIVVYFAVWYLFLCVIYRNIEIRYLLLNDMLLLIPMAFLVNKVKDTIVKTKLQPTK